ncbi:hypothetical protein [Nocardiopsis salina]|uniref:hypothetical protein n=1 Tax=Nocardiopsis salina TaxID=245836 RepID=UPI0018729FF6|nr:hypothetical protein [Nocardiopsis salina]
MNQDRWFPLVPRKRPPAEPIGTRVERILRDAALARTSQGQEAANGLARAFNGAALIASDAHMPDLARTWCWEHAEHHLGDLPLSRDRACRALEPVVNLARLEIRAGRPDHALDILERLLRGLREGTPVRVHDRVLPLDRITRTESERVEVYRWAWAVYLGDGMRALATQGRWQDAAEQARLLGGVGQRLFDGRQVTVLSLIAGGETEQALRLVDESEIREPWECCVQLILRLRCNQEAEGAEELVETIRTLSMPLFATRAGLSMPCLLARGRPVVGEFLVWLVETASTDGYAARDLLDDARAALSGTQHESLAKVCTEAGLGPNTLPENILNQVRHELQELSQDGWAPQRALHSER